MKAITFTDALRLQDVPNPAPAPGEVVVRVVKAGICNTDIEITRGYVPGFSGVLGHEFYGFIDAHPDPVMRRTRVTAEINCGCGSCDWCRRNMQRHCPGRTVLGIINRNGALAEYVRVPEANVVEIPDEIPDSSAILIEPLAAALEILEQVPINSTHDVLLLGDGKLALLIALILGPTECRLTVVGKHPAKLGLVQAPETHLVLLSDFQPRQFDVVIEATGNPSAFDLGIRCTKPRGVFVLKSTYAKGFDFNPASVVVNEITVVGSRCGRFEDAIRFLMNHRPDLSPLISAVYPLSQGMDAFEHAQKKGAMKVVVEC